jgi:hypothetical protein
MKTKTPELDKQRVIIETGRKTESLQAMTR